MDKIDSSSITNGSALSYFHALCRQPVPGPLVGGSAASKDVNKWIDEMIAWYDSSSELQRSDTRKLLISLLKILSQHYGKLRSPFASDPSQEVLPLLLYSVIELFVYYISPLFSLVRFLLLSLFIFTTCNRKHCVIVICFELDGVNQNLSWISISYQTSDLHILIQPRICLRTVFQPCKVINTCD
jgi:hypothetical protein